MQFFSESTQGSKVAEWLGAVTKAFKTDPRKTILQGLSQNLLDKDYRNFGSTSEY